GNHGRDYYNPDDQKLTMAFLDRFVSGVKNGFERRVPHMSVGMETAIDRDGKENEPAWSINRKRLGLRVEPRSFFVRSNGRMTSARPGGNESGDSYQYPQPAPDVTEPGPTAGGMSLGQFTWKGPVPPGGSVAYTSPPLRKDMILGGPASLNLWLASTATDTDIEA